MKKTILTTLIALMFLLSACSQSDTEQNTPEQYVTESNDTKEEMKNLLPFQKSQYSTPAAKEITQEDLVKQHKVKTITRTEQESTTVEFYNEIGELIKEKVDADRFSDYAYEHDSQGNVTKETTSHNGDLHNISKYTYVANKVKTVDWYRKNGERHGGIVYEYEDATNSVFVKTSNGYYREFYNDRGVLVRTEWYEDEDNVTLDCYREYKYSVEGWKISMDFYRIGDEENTIGDVYTYNEKGQKITEYNGYHKHDVVFSYNENGLLTKEVSTGEYSNSDIIEYAYTYH